MSLWHLLIVFGIVLVVFDRNRIPRVGKAMSEFMRALKSGAQGKEDIDVTELSTHSSSPDFED